MNETTKPLGETKPLASTLKTYEPASMGLEDCALPMEAEPHGEGEWIVRLKAPDDADARGWISLGTLVRTGAHSFAYRPGEGSEVCMTTRAEEVTIEAADVDAAMVDIRAHTKLTSKTRMAIPDDRMAQLVVSALMDLNRLACQSGALPGFVSGLAATWGTLLVEDVNSEGETALLDHMLSFIRETIDYAAKVAKCRREHEALRAVVGAIVGALPEAVGRLDPEPKPTMQ